MAHNNAPFIIARKIFEGNKADNKWNIPVKNQRNFPTLLWKDLSKSCLKDTFILQKVFIKQSRAFKTTEPDYSG
jgi:hypothetical protein